jgi:hypothetical protein
LSRDGSITLAWAGGEHLFRLGWGELRSIQEACDAGPFVVLERLGNGSWKLEDISSVIRFGLIGGGVPPVEASKLVRLYVEKFPPAESCIVAHAVLTAGCIGAPEEQIEKKSEAPDRYSSDLTTFQTEKSGSELSTESVTS